MSRGGWWLLLGCELVVLLSVALAPPEPAAAPPAPADAPPPANGLVALLTDYGSGDQYAGILRGVILSANPAARVIDLTHEVANFDLASAAFILSQTAPEWPAGTTFVVVVDPGVGTSRKKLAAWTWPDGKRYVAPDNGVLTDVLAAAERVEVRELTNSKLARPGAETSTFHGRDWFGPLAGHLAAGVSPAEVGPPVMSVVGLPRIPPREADGVVTGSVVYLDHYGNLLTTISTDFLLGSALAGAGELLVRIGSGPERRVPWVKTYADVPPGQPLLTTTNGPRRAEIAVNYGSAKEAFGAVAGSRVELRRAGG